MIRLKTRLTIRQLTYVQTILSQALTPVPVPLSLSTDYFKGACPALPPSPKISSGQPAPFSASSQTELPAQTRKFKTRTTIVFYRLCFQVLSIENVFTAIKYTRWFRFLISGIVTQTSCWINAETGRAGCDSLSEMRGGGSRRLWRRV